MTCCVSWISRHPRTIGWIAIMQALSLLLHLVKTAIETLGGA